MSGAIPSLPHTSSWRGVQLKKHMDSFTLLLILIIMIQLYRFLIYNNST